MAGYQSESDADCRHGARKILTPFQPCHGRVVSQFELRHYPRTKTAYRGERRNGNVRVANGGHGGMAQFLRRTETHGGGFLLLLKIGFACIALSSCGPNAPQRSVDDNSFVIEATIRGIQSAISAHETTCRRIVDAYLRRIEAYDSETGLNAITVVAPDARAVADAIDRRLAQGERLGPLFCAPLLIKDNVDTVGLETSGGSIALKGKPVPRDAFIVSRLRNADAVIIAKTNMAEWAFSPRQSVSSSFGVTTNAYSREHVPAGSSGGTASAVVANFAVAGIGTDTGNSIRGPSSHLSLVGIRPTIGLVSRSGIIPLFADRDVAGPMARTVEDAALILNAIATADNEDSYTQNSRVHRSADYTAALNPAALQRKRIGVLRAIIDPAATNSEILNLFEQALADMRTSGAEIIDPVEIPNLDRHFVTPSRLLTFVANVGVNPSYLCLRFRYDLARYLERRGLVDGQLDLPQILASRSYSDDPLVKARLETWARFPRDTPPSNWDTPCPEYFEHSGRQSYLADVTAMMETNNLDAVVYPSWAQPPASINRANEGYAGDNSQLVAPATGLPAATVPMGWLSSGLPAGLQFLGRAYSEDEILAFAFAYERTTHHRHPPVRFPALAAP
jgi:amidase